VSADDHTETETQVYPKAILGYRVWRIWESEKRRNVRDDTIPVFLWPLHVETAMTWERGVNTAECLIEEHAAPAADCKCGFNAHHDLFGAVTEADEWCKNWREDDHPVLVIGLIAGKGAVEMHRGGFRCEQAQILGLMPVEVNEWRRAIHLGSSYDLVKSAAKHYQVPLYTNVDQLKRASRDLLSSGELVSAPKEALPSLTITAKSRSASQDRMQRLAVRTFALFSTLTIVTGATAIGESSVLFGNIAFLFFAIALFGPILMLVVDDIRR